MSLPNQQEPSGQSAPSARDVVEVALYWGGSLVEVRRLESDGAITIGDCDAATFRISDSRLPAQLMSLVEKRGSEVCVRLTEGMRGTQGGRELDLGPHFLTRADLGSTASKMDGSHRDGLCIEIGALVLRVGWSRASRRITAPFWTALDIFYSKVFAVTLVAQAAAVAALLITPALGDDDDFDLVASATQWIQVQTKTEKPKPKPKPKVVQQDKPEVAKATFGEKKTVRTARAAARVARREQAMTQAQNVLKALGLEGSQGGRGPGLSSQIANSIDQLRGAGLGQSSGSGLVIRGGGPGGGGGALSIGRVGSPGGGGGNGNSGVDLCGGGDCKGKRAVTVRSTKTIVVGGLKKGEIQRVVSRHLNQIRTCYERQLTKDPNLMGKLDMFWMISPSGAVSTSKVNVNTLRDGKVEACVKRVVDRMRFPKPRGGGTVNVRYPFVFATN